MKVLLVNGSPRAHGCTYTALCEVAKALEEEGIETEIFQTGTKPVKTADGFVFGSPVYYAHPAGQVLSLLDRAFYAGGAAFAGKPGAAVVSARRGGTAASFDVLNKYFTICRMPVVSSSYWNMVYGNTPEEVKQDLEGMQTMRNLGRNMAYRRVAVPHQLHPLKSAAGNRSGRTQIKKRSSLAEPPNRRVSAAAGGSFFMQKFKNFFRNLSPNR